MTSILVTYGFGRFSSLPRSSEIFQWQNSAARHQTAQVLYSQFGVSSIFEDERIAAAFLANGSNRTMATIDGRIIRQHHQFIKNAIHQYLVTAARQIGTAYA